MRTALGAVAIMVATVVLTAAPAHADPDPTPPTPYQVPTPDGPVLPGNAPLPQICAHWMQSCGYSLDPGTWTWQPRGTNAP
ncbi:MAG TPA: hypothetical protein VMB04_08535 [Mycobacterium sp.]|nr:hypothetical protein [Mycobacterium sp.]